MNINVDELLQQIGVDDRDGLVRGEAETVVRLSRAKCPSVNKDENLRSYVAMDLALGKLGIVFNRRKLIEAAPCKEKVYNVAYQRLRNLLGHHVAPLGGRIEHLAVKFAGGSAERSRELLTLYQAACRAMLTAEMSARLDFDTAEYHAAAFCVASVEAKAQLKRKVVAEEVKLDSRELDKICVDIVRKCGLIDTDHVARAFRLHAPASEEQRGDDGRNNEKDKGRRLSPAENGGGGNGGGGVGGGRGAGRDSDASPATSNPRLDVPGSSSPLSPRAQSGNPRGLPSRNIQFGDTARISSSKTRDHDPSASLKSWVKRLRTLDTPVYRDWRQATLGE